MTETLERGQQIPGSKLYREFCAGCSTPIRVTAARLFVHAAGEYKIGEIEQGTRNYCEECDPRSTPAFGAALTERQRAVLFRQSDRDI